MVTPTSNLHLNLRTQVLKRDERHRNYWEVVITPTTLLARETALLLCDVWDHHSCRGATERLEEMVPRMNQIAKIARGKGVWIIHAPSGTMDFYAHTPARRRMMNAPHTAPPVPAERPEPPLPVDASDDGPDTGENTADKAWLEWAPHSQHPGIEIDHEKDGISDDGQQVYNLMAEHGIRNLLIMGVHTNMCILKRSFAVEQMVKWGKDVALVRDLTDAMYNPAMPPYVSHDEGTRLVIEYIEKFWCPTITSAELTGDGPID